LYLLHSTTFILLGYSSCNAATFRFTCVVAVLCVVCVVRCVNCFVNVLTSDLMFEFSKCRSDLAVLMFVMSREVYSVFTVFISEVLTASVLL